MPDLTDFTSMEFSVARGEAAFPMTRGSFDYTDSVSSREKLRIVAGSAGAAAALRAMGVRNVVVKCGPEGVVVDCAQGKLAYPARKVKVVDTTGVGDNFVAGFITGLLDGCDVRECCERGTEQASKTVQHVGATQ